VWYSIARGDYMKKEEFQKKLIEMYNNNVKEEVIAELYNSELKKQASISSIKRTIRKWRKQYAIIGVRNEIEQHSPEMIAHNLKGLTVQRDSHGNIVQYWTKTKPEENERYNQILEAIKEIKPYKLEQNTNIQTTKEETLLEIPLFDMHFGINTYKDYKGVLEDISDLIRLKQRKKIIFVIGQDLFHNNDLKGNTSNGTPIEKVDMKKAINDAYNFYFELVNIAYDYADEVEIIYSKGNHDESAAFIFLQMFAKMFSEDIKFDLSLDDKKVRTFGKVFIGWSHSDKGKKNVNRNIRDIRGVFAELFKMKWAKTDVRELHFGHLHHEKPGDGLGFMVRVLSTAAKTDQWHLENDYVGSHKRFMLFEYSAKKLKTIHYI